MNEIGVFCETYGNTISNRILEFLLENKGLDFAIGDMAKELGVSKPKAYEVVKEFENKGYVNKSRIIGKTQLYVLNEENKRVKLFLKDFRECLRLVAEEYGAKPKAVSSYEDAKNGQEDVLLARVFVGKIDVTEKLLEAV